MGLLSKALKYKKKIGEKRDARNSDELNRFIEDVYSESGGRDSGIEGSPPGDASIQPIQGKKKDHEGIPSVSGDSSGQLPDVFPVMKDSPRRDEDSGEPRHDEGPERLHGKGRERGISGDRMTSITEDGGPIDEDLPGKISGGSLSDGDEPVVIPGPLHDGRNLKAAEKKEVPGEDGPGDGDFISGGESLQRDELKFSDFMVLYEIQKEIARAGSADELYDAILFSIMGQIGASSSSIMVRSPKNPGQWVIVKSIGVSIENQDLYFNPGAGILRKMFEKMGIADIDDYKNDPALIDEYYKYISIDAKLLVPLIQGYEVLGTVILGEKIDSGDFTEEDRDFLRFIGEVSAIALNTINTMEMIMKVNENLSKDFGYIRDVDRFKKKIFHDLSLQKIEQDLQGEFEAMGITGYAVYARGSDEKTFAPVITDRSDLLKLSEGRHSIREKSGFIRFMNKPESPVTIDNPRDSEILGELFSIEQILKMTLFRIFPFITGNEVLGFILVFRIAEEAVLEEVDKKLVRISDFLFGQIRNIQSITIRHSSYIDNIEIIFSRIDEEIMNSKNLGIPLTIVMMSIKNHKRYYTLFGHGAFRKLLDGFEGVIKKRLSDNDFSIRYGRNKILLVLPGKDKKYAAPLASSITNEITGTFNSREIQLLITSLSAEYPADGQDLNTLIDIIDY